jgi:hypothetical protein
VIAIPMPGAAVVAAAIVAIQRRNTSLDRLIADWRPARTGAESLP